MSTNHQTTEDPESPPVPAVPQEAAVAQVSDPGDPTAASPAAESAAGTGSAGGAPAEAAPTGPPAATIVVAMAGGFLALLDSTIVNVSLKATTARFGDVDQVQWVVTAYLIALAALMPATGWLTTRFGLKRVFTGAITLFAFGSLACALSQTLPELITARGLSGAAAGVLTPASTILLTRGVPREQLGRVQSLNGSMMLISPLLGPTAGGLLVAVGGWPAVYAINVPLCLVLVFIAMRWVAKDGPATKSDRPLDVLGLLSAAVCTVCVVLAIHAFSGEGSLVSPVLLVPLALALVSGTVFVVHGLRARFPLLDLRLFANRVYRMAVVNIFCLGFVLYSPMMLIPLYFESARGETPVTTGLLMSTGGLGVVVAGWTCGQVVKRLGGGGTVVLGMLLTIAATVPLTSLSSHTSYVLLCGSLVIRGMGTGLTIVPAMTRAFQSIRPESIGDASSQLNLTQRIGGAMAIALVTVVLTQSAEKHRGLVPAAFAHSFAWLVGVYAVTLIPAVALLLADRREARLAAVSA